MNERIEKLLEQCQVEKHNQFGDLIEFGIDAEKFVELIVRECIDIAQDRANFPGFPPNDVNHIIDEIREHFGVDK